MHIEGEHRSCDTCNNYKGCKEKDKELPTCFNWHKKYLNDGEKE